jgi:membrane-associated phospholipid phosphatase
VPETPSADRARQLSLRVLGIYVAASSVVHLWNATRGHWDLRLAVVEAFLLYAVFAKSDSPHWVWRRIGDWLPLFALPLLYGGLEWSMVGQAMQDGAVQGWDRALFGTDPARTMAGAMPWAPLSEFLHFAYFSYYGIIYGPPLYLYLRNESRRAFHDVVLAFTVAMVAAFVAFTFFPVAGPRYLWPAPTGVPDGPVRRLVLWVLHEGSTRGTAFPSSHVAIALAISLSALRSNRVAGVVLLATTVLLGVGAVYGGFHYATDVVAGMALGVGSWGISTLVDRRSFGADQKS